ncbi:hypothetical protein DFH08DRAFT_827548 [Mycena albidolilacea]|uniref:Uncharacterized protein n=1 Tax=Mycena albidolilacea TaxID=1033008 RepID=A0AAD6YXU5_9AGAR|nr:hypothetical protein DFH08DRAFT_827548 [Mycena albidolilacea]
MVQLRDTSRTRREMPNSAGLSEPETFRCSHCRKYKEAADFGTKKNGLRAGTCRECQLHARDAACAKKTAEKENDPGKDAEEEHYDSFNLTVLPLTDFLDTLVHQDNNLELVARTRKDKANEIAVRIWNRMKYRFVYHSKYDHKRTPSSCFMYHCAQSKERQNAPKKSQREGAKHRDKLPMDAFKCHGWLHITIMDGENIALIKISHSDDHIPYWSIDIPTDVIAFVKQNPKLTPGQLWDEILKNHPRPSFTRQVIYAMWAENNAMEWKRDPDELKSAQILLDEFTASEPTPTSGGKEPLYTIEQISLTSQPGFTAIVFALPKLLREVGGRVSATASGSAKQRVTRREPQPG